MSKKACTPDNAACEGFFGRIKNEMFYNRSWQGVTIEEFMAYLDSYLCWYNEKRIKMSLGGLSPVHYRKQLEIAAWSLQENVRISFFPSKSIDLLQTPGD